MIRSIPANGENIVRRNALAGNIVLYKTVNGIRSSLSVKGRWFGRGINAEIASGKWNDLRVDCQGALVDDITYGEK